jgi:hypothetical protein
MTVGIWEGSDVKTSEVPEVRKGLHTLAMITSDGASEDNEPARRSFKPI